MNIYMYNSRTRLLHITGFCNDAPLDKVDDYMYFASENAAIAYAGRQICMCIKCAQRRDNLLSEVIATQKKKNNTQK